MKTRYFKNANNNLFRNPLEKDIAKFSLTEITKDEFDTILNTPKPVTLEDYQNSAKQALEATRVCASERLPEAIALGKTTWDAVDVVAFLAWRSEVRAEIEAKTVGILPTFPGYPANT